MVYSTEINGLSVNIPTSPNAAPHLTINHDVAADLDSTNAFEGPEKLLEVWFAACPETLPASASPLGLKAVSSARWKEVLDLVNCQVLSIIGHDNIDAYLLSESSMFVFPHKVILKTCGTTTLLHGLPRMLELAASDAGFPGISADAAKGTAAVATPYRVFYSRKNYLNPQKQKGPHRSWKDEVGFLDRMFLGGSAYLIGKMNGDHWYLYMTGPESRLTPPGTPDSESGYLGTETKWVGPRQRMIHSKPAHETQDETLEILMTDLDEQNARQFYLEDAVAAAKGKFLQKAAVMNGEEPSVPEELTTEGHRLGDEVSELCGLADVYPAEKYPEAKIDSYLFTPCGYSANGVVPAPGKKDSTSYWTVHVTPEPHCSYASFETNVPVEQSGRETADLVEQVVNVFKPGRFSVTLFEAKPPGGVGGVEGFGQAAKAARRVDDIPGYRRADRIVHDLDGYDLVFRYYERHDWVGGAPRLGETLL